MLRQEILRELSGRLSPGISQTFPTRAYFTPTLLNHGRPNPNMDDSAMKALDKHGAEHSARVAVGALPLSRTSPVLDYNFARTELLYKDGRPYALAANFEGSRYFMQFRECEGIGGGVSFRVLNPESAGRDMTREDFEKVVAVFRDNPPKDWTKRLPRARDGERADDCMVLARLEFRALELKRLGR